jgi:hypothetical protein
VHGAACGRKGAANEVLLATCSPVLAAEAERGEKSQDTRVKRSRRRSRAPQVPCGLVIDRGIPGSASLPVTWELSHSLKGKTCGL